MAFTLYHRHHVVGVGADLLHLVQCAAGSHKAERAAVDVLQRLPPQSQTEPVHRHHGQPSVVDLKQCAGVDGARLVHGHGKAGLLYHILQRPLLQRHGVFVVHLRQLRIVVTAQPRHLKAGVAAVQLHVQLLVGVEQHHVVRQPPYHLAEQPRIQHDPSRLLHLGVHRGADPRLHIVPGQAQPVLALQQDTLQGGDGALCRHGAGHRRHRLLQQRLFTGKSHHIRRSSLSEKFPVLFFKIKS